MNSITFLIAGLKGGGTERICVTLANEFVNKGILVNLVVLSLDGAVRDKELNSKVNLVNLNTRNTRKSFFSVKDYISKNKTKKILVFNFQLAVVLVWIRMFSDLHFKIIARNINTLSEKSKLETNIWHKYITHFLTKVFYQKVDLLIAQSIGMTDDLIENYRFDKNNIKIINNPVNKRIEEYKINFEQSKNNKEVLFVGRFAKAKGLKYLLEAFSLIEDKEVKLRLVGEGKEKEFLIELSKKLKIENRIIFDKFQTNIIPYFLNAKVTVLTSIYEGFPNVLVESISLGTPIVSFDCKSGPREIIQDGINGYLVDYLNIQDLKSKLELALSIQWDNKSIIQTGQKYKIEPIVNNYIRSMAKI